MEKYTKRVQQLKSELSKIDFKKLDIKEEDLIDPCSKADNPVKINFNDISAAAYRLKGGIENTPCTVSSLHYIISISLNLFHLCALRNHICPI